MIPLVLPSLHGLSVMVTRPEGQAMGLLARLEQLGAQTVYWPTLTIEPLPVSCSADTPCDLLIFISVNAVAHGAALLQHYPAARLAAVGAATARALEALGHTLDAVPQSGSNSEALLNHPLLLTPPPHITLVSGQGGRELLQDTLLARGAQVTVVESYARRPLMPTPGAIAQLQQACQEDGVHILTATSIEVLQALETTLAPDLLKTVQGIALLCGSPRIAEAARAMGWYGERVVSRSPQEIELLDALQCWHTRQRAAIS